MNTTLRIAAAGVITALMATTATANVHEDSGKYAFGRKETPTILLPYTNTVIVAAPHSVTTINGDLLTDTKDTIADCALNPTFASYATLTLRKKGKRELKFMRNSEYDSKLYQYDTGKYGLPTGVIFTPDARNVIVSTASDLHVFDTRKLRPVSRFYAVPVETRRMVMSPNGYFLVLVNGPKVVIYNYEDKTIRTTIDAEVPVNDVAFTDDSRRMGILTDDGLLTIYDTRTMTMQSTVDELGDGLAFTFNDSGKYIAVVTDSNNISVINLLRNDDRQTFTAPGGASDVALIKDALGNTMMTYTATGSVCAERLLNLVPYYTKLVSDEVDGKMNEWMKMRPGETMEEYQKRVNPDSVKAQRRLYEDEMSTSLAGDLIAMSEMSLGKYNREKELLEVNLSNMPAVYLPVPAADISAFHDGKELSVTDAQYGLLPDDSFELIYGKFHNSNDGKTYTYDNLNRVPMAFMDNDDNIVSLEVMQQQQLEEMKLEELRNKVLDEARHDNIISEHTSIAVDSRVVPDYDANGKRILNYVVSFTYQVEPEFSAVEDFAPGRYHVDESGAAMSMLNIVKQAFEGDFAKYVKPGAKLRVNLSGTADATPILRGIAYDGAYGDFEDEPIMQDGTLKAITVTQAGGIRTNEQLAFMRAVGVQDYLRNRISGLDKMNADYRYNIGVSEDKGSEYRRISAEFTFYDVF